MKTIISSTFLSLAMLGCLFLTSGCERWSPRGEYRVIGTATVNGEEYVDMAHRGWNTEFRRISLPFYPDYNMFSMGYVFLQPKKIGEVINYYYRIAFTLTTENQQIQTNLPYKIEHNSRLEKEDYYWTNEFLHTLVYDKSKIISPEAYNGVAIVEDYRTKEIYSMEGFVTILEIDFANDLCIGEYVLKRPVVPGEEELTIIGKFKAEPYETSLILLNNQ